MQLDPQLSNLIEVNNTHLDSYLIAHKIWRNAATGVRHTYKIEDLIENYELTRQFINIQRWFFELRGNLLRTSIEIKSKTIADIIKMARETDDLDEKRLYLIDAIRLEQEIVEIIDG